MSRHTARALSTGLAAVCLLGSVSIAAATGSPALAAATPVPAMSADAFVNSIGVDTHLTYGDTPYGNQALIAQRLGELGVKHLRDGWGTGSSWASDYARNTLGPMGIKMTMVMDPRLNATPMQLKDMVKSQLLPVMDGAESLNEWDTHGTGWSTAARDWTVGVSNAFRGDPVTASVPLIGPSMADTLNAGSHTSMGDLSPYLDYGNTHDYPGDAYQMTDHIIDVVQQNVGAMVPGKPIIATETGFSNGNVNQPYPAMPEAQTAVLLPRLFLEHFRRGITRTFSYELIDEHPDNQFESRFGLLRNDGTPKPSFNAIARMTSLLSDPGPSFTPVPLAYSMSGNTASTRTQLLQKRDGTYWLAVWQQDKVFDGTSVLTPPAVPVTLTLPAPVAQASVYSLRGGKADPALSTVSNTGTVNLQSSADVTLLKLSGTGAVTQPPTTFPAFSRRINSGGPAMTENGVAFLSDRYFLGGNTAVTPEAIASATPLADASERWASSGYHIPVPAKGTYSLRLRFVETAFSNPGQRIFDVRAETGLVANKLDIVSRAGGRNKAYTLEVPVTVTDGYLDIRFTSYVDNATVSAIQVVRTS